MDRNRDVQPASIQRRRPSDPLARERAFDMAQQDPPTGVSPLAAAVAIAEVLKSIGDACPDCLPN
jgi:hypothetical protein